MKTNLFIIPLVLLLYNCLPDESSEQSCNEQLWYQDKDGDGIGDPSVSILSCDQPSGFTLQKSEISNPDPRLKDQEFTFTAGKQEIFLNKDTKAGYGFHMFTPDEYTEVEESGFPLLIFLHGGGGRGQGDSVASFDTIIFGVDPPSLIQANNWNPPEPIIVATPQSPGLWEPERLHNFISYLIVNMNVDTSRIYMTGFSMGGRGVFDYITEYSSQSYTAAVVPIAGWSRVNQGEPFKNVPLWAFHGSADSDVPSNGSKDMVNAINNSSPKIKAKLTIFPGVDHFSWPRVYDNSAINSGDPKYDLFDMSIYEWMLQFKK